MKIVQKSKLKYNSTKNSMHLTSHIKAHTSQKGITLMSLIIYMTVMFVILALIMRVSTYFTKNISEVADTTFEEEFEKLNMYMLQETNKSGNGIYKISEHKITFADDNIIEFRKEETSETGEIYFNEIKICENVSACTFTTTDNEETGKTTITVDLTINETTKKQQYIIITWMARLPAAYQEVEYIESTGTQYIDLGIIATNNYGAEIEYAYTSNSSDDSAMLFGTRNGVGGDGAFAYITTWQGDLASTLYIAYNYSSTDETNIKVDFKWHKISCNVLNDKNVYYDENLIGTGNNTEFTSKAQASLFRVYYQTTYLEPTKAKVKMLKIYNNGNMVNNYIPCYRIQDKEIGLYDIINDEFYTNSGQGTFLKGKEINSVIEKNYFVKKINEHEIPTDYQEVEYIESTGTQYIDLDFYATNNYGAEIEYAFTSTSSSDSARLFGTRNGANGDGAFSFISSWSGNLDSPLFIAANGLAYNNTNETKINIDLNWHNISCNVLNDKKVYYDENLIGTGNNTEFTANGQAVLFRTYNQTSYGNPTKAKVKLLRIYNNGELINEFYPCYHKDSKQIGLYDTVEGKFYANSGTGEFKKGPEVD